MKRISQINSVFRGLEVKLKLILPTFLSVVNKTREKLKPFVGIGFRYFHQTGIKVCKSALTLSKAALKTLLRNQKLILVLLPLLVIFISINRFHTVIYGPNISRNLTLFIHNGDNFEHVVSLLKEEGCLADVKTFERFAWFK
jgi:hypothetical protein